MRLLVTRTPEDAAPLVAALEARGHACLVEPLYGVVPAAVDDAALAEALDGVQALLFTSANGARAFTARSPRRDLPVYAVGDATAAAARAAGFAQVESAGGDVEALAALAGAHLDPAQGPLFHAAARQVAGDLQGLLAAKGFSLRRLVLYEARPVERLSAETQAALRNGAIDAALIFSPRSGGSFVRLLTEAGLQDSGGRVYALCLSAAVAEAVASIDWAGTMIAARPETAALFDAVDGLAARRTRDEATSLSRTDSTAEDQQVDDKQSDNKQAGAETLPPPGALAGDGPASGGPADGAAEPPALAVIAAFGGIRPMAAKLGIAVSTVQGWRERGVIPQPRHDEIMTAARNNSVELDAALLAASDRPPVTAPLPRGSVPQSGSKPGASAGDKGHEPVKQPERPEAAAPAAVAAAAKAQAAQIQAPHTETRSRGGAGWAFFLLGAVVFGAGAAAAVVTQPQWQPLLAELTGQTAPAAGPSDLEQRLAALEGNLGKVDTELTRIAALPPPASGDTGAVAASIDSLNERLAALEKETQGMSSGAPSGLAAEELAPLQDAVEQLTKRLQAVEGQAGGDVADGEKVATLSDELTSLATRLAEAEGRLASVEDERRSLQASIDKLAEASQVARDTAGGSAALALAIGQLRDALRSGAAYGAELEQLRGLSLDDAALAALLDPLAPYAATGAPSLEALQRSFPPVARDAVAAAQGDEAEGWLGGVLRRVSGVVTVRPVGEVEGESAGAVIARAEARLQAGDLAAAVAELDSLQGRAEEEVRAWRDQAQARVVAERALSQLAAHAIAKLGPNGN